MLLGPDDPDPVAIVNRFADAPFLLLGDHAGNAITAALDQLGLSRADRERHIAIDLGTHALGLMMAERLRATFVHQRYSRLVIDCNRAPDRADAVPETSDGTPVPGNRGLNASARQARIDSIHAPYHAAIAAEVERRRADGQEPVLVSLHSFTPHLVGGSPRPWQIGVLHQGHRDAFARALLGALITGGDLLVGDNEPYRMDDTDYTIPRHAFANDLAYVEIEIRQDLLGCENDVIGWAARLGDALEAALRSVSRQSESVQHSLSAMEGDAQPPADCH